MEDRNLEDEYEPTVGETVIFVLCMLFITAIILAAVYCQLVK